MSLRRLPIVATVLVLASVITMVWLGVWQLDRMGQKNALLERYTTIAPDAAVIAYPQTEAALEEMLYRRIATQCETVSGISSMAGTNRAGAKGWAHLASCALSSGAKADVALGWTRTPAAPEWAGGAVTGILAPGGRIVADPPLAGLAPLIAPDPADLPNNHLAYAGQWFLFALTALVIYGLALRRKQRD